MSDITSLLEIEQNCRNCNSLDELLFLVVNETRVLVHYDQSLLLEKKLNNSYKTIAASDIQVIDRTAPYINLVESIAKNNFFNDEFKDVKVLKHTDIKQEDLNKLREYAPPHIIYIPIKLKKNNLEVDLILLLFRQKPFMEKEENILKHIASSYAYFLLPWRKVGFRQYLKKLNKRHFYLTSILIIGIMFIPIKMSVLAPFQVEAKKPFLVTSALNATIKKIHVEPNEIVSKNTLIIELEDSEFKSDYDVSIRAYEVAKARLHTAKQSSFFDKKQKNLISTLETEVELKKVELEFSKKQLEKTKIYSKKDGVVIINNPKEWEGKPVIIGERILKIADENSIELSIMLAVNESVFLQKEADVKVFFDNAPLSSLNAKVSHISYIPMQTPEQILSYKIIADLNDINSEKTLPAIGTRGYAKIYSDEVTLFFYLFRRPITAVRQFIGW